MIKIMPIYKVVILEETYIGWYAYDEVHKRELLIYNSMHGLSELRISKEDLRVSYDNGDTWEDMENES